MSFHSTVHWLFFSLCQGVVAEEGQDFMEQSKCFTDQQRHLESKTRMSLKDILQMCSSITRPLNVTCVLLLYMLCVCVVCIAVVIIIIIIIINNHNF